MKCLGSFLRPATNRYGASGLHRCPESWHLVTQFVLTPLLPSQVDLEWELEHKEALLAHCMKREAEEVWEALV